MRHQSRPADFQMLFNLSAASLEDFEKQTGIALSKHPLTEQLRDSDSAESVIAILQEQVPDCSKFGGSDRITKSLRNVVSVLYTLSISVNIYWVRSKMLIGLFHFSYLFYRRSPLRHQYMTGLLSYSQYVSFLLPYVRIF
jgi:hypothetical protein